MSHVINVTGVTHITGVTYVSVTNVTGSLMSQVSIMSELSMSQVSIMSQSSSQVSPISQGHQNSLCPCGNVVITDMRYLRCKQKTKHNCNIEKIYS